MHPEISCFSEIFVVKLQISSMKYFCIDQIMEMEEVTGGARRDRRLRSLSMSYDWEFSSRSSFDTAYLDSAFVAQPGFVRQYSKPLGPSDRTLSVNSISSYNSCAADLINLKRNGFSFLQWFDFQSLPDDVKLKIFSFLGAKDRGVSARVCREWEQLTRHPNIWSVVDFTEFKLCLSTSELHRECSILCYNAYRQRMKKFFRYLLMVKPIIRYLRFSLDIGDTSDEWNDQLRALLKTSRCKDLTVADMNWAETPFKKPFILQSTSVTWSHSDFRDLTFRRRHRQRYFIRFLDLFTAVAPNVTELRLPFDWCERSQQAFSRLTNLRTLDLRKYFNYGHIEPAVFVRFFQSLSSLVKLTLEVWTEGYGGFYQYQMQSTTIEYLDISTCRGLYLNRMLLPNLRTFKVSRYPRTFEISLGDGINVDTPCMYGVLCHGTPKLEWLNEHRLLPGWKVDIYPELEQVLKTVCSCAAHKSPD